MSRLPETDGGLVRKLRQRDRQAVRQADSSAYNRSGISIAAEGVAVADGILQSWDYDGTSVTALGTTGWHLGPDVAGASRLVLNGIDVYADLAAKQAALETAQATLATQQATLTAQQATLTAQVAQIAALVNAQVTGAPGNASYGSPSSPASISTTATNYASATIAVPSGFTRALVIATSSLAAQNASLILMNTRIAGSDGLVMNIIADASGWANGSSNFSAELTGLSGSFDVSSRCQAGIPGVTGMVTTSALVTFLR